VVQSGLVIPWDVAFAPDGEMFVTERPGRVRVYASGGPGAPLLGTTTLKGVRAQGESGVMGIAVDHYFRVNRLVYICVSRTFNGSWLNQLIRYKVASDWTLKVDRILIKYGMRAASNHNGCAVEEGPDRHIWLTMGDAGDAIVSQNPKRLNGKVLRIKRSGAIPDDNPIMPGATKRTAVYSMGHRNPQGIAFHPGTGEVYAVEHGPSVSDEVNWIRPGLNYGWPCVTGFGDPYLACGGGGGYTDPAWESGGSTIATSNGAFAAGDRWGSYRNHLFVATLKEQDLRHFKLSDGGSVATQRGILYDNRWGRLRATVIGPNGNLWITTSNGSNDKVIRITP
jgi:glucose/arabinose dehydrogenase